MVFECVDFLKKHDGFPCLKHSHKFYTQVQAQMWVCGVSHSFFVVWTLGYPPLYKEIMLDTAFMTKVINNLTLFYKAYVVPCMLGYRNLLQCPKCEKVILDLAELNVTATERSICCDTCNTWLCFSCLIDNAGPIDDDDSDLGDGRADHEQSTLCDPTATTSQGIPHTSSEVDHVCSLCHMLSIPVGGEHICSICKNAVHAWCSNHEQITSSSDLVCNY